MNPNLSTSSPTPVRCVALRIAAERVVAPAVGTMLVLAVLAGFAPHANARAVHRRGPLPAPTTRMAVSIAARGHRPRVPEDFLGLSFEIKYAGQIADLARKGDLVTLLRSLGHGVVRLGGVTADTQVAWSRDGRSIPSWANTPITPGTLASLGELVRRAGWKALLTVNLGHSDVRSAAQESAAAVGAFGSALAGIEVGNEPSAFVSPDGLRSAPWAFPDYRAEIDAYRAAIAGAAPRIRIAGPDAPSGRSQIANWMIPEASAEHPDLLTEHYYSYGCAQGPTNADLLRPSVRVAEAAMFRRMQGVAAQSGIPLRVDETNNVSCGGIAGVSDTFAASLWAIDFLTRAMSAGLAGINFHDVITTAHGYSPLVATSLAALASGRIETRPEWYALLMAHELVGDRALPVKLTPGGLNVAVSAYSGPSAEHIVIVDDQQPGSRTLSVRLPLPHGFTSGTVLRLSGASPTATGGVTLGGAGVTPAGAWRPKRPLPTVIRDSGGVRVSVAPTSAVLVTLATRSAHR